MRNDLKMDHSSPGIRIGPLSKFTSQTEHITNADLNSGVKNSSLISVSSHPDDRVQFRPWRDVVGCPASPSCFVAQPFVVPARVFPVFRVKVRDGTQVHVEGENI